MKYIEATEYGSDRRYGVPFGKGRENLRTLNPKLDSDERMIEVALRLGWSNGCPIARELTGPDSPYGTEWMLKRYSETSYWFQQAVSIARRQNRAVYDLLTTPRVRLPDEGVGKHEPLSVPRSHIWRISPMTALEGYATPRLLIGIKDQNWLLSPIKAYEVLRDSLSAAGEKPWHFLAILSEKTVSDTFNPETVLRHVYPKEVLMGENCQTTYLNLAKSLEIKAPTIWKALINLPKRQREELEIAEIPTPK